jgi:hypothetical protein
MRNTPLIPFCSQASGGSGFSHLRQASARSSPLAAGPSFIYTNQARRRDAIFRPANPPRVVKTSTTCGRNGRCYPDFGSFDSESRAAILSRRVRAVGSPLSEQRYKPFGSGVPLQAGKGLAQWPLQLRIPQPLETAGSRMAERGRNPSRQADPTTDPREGSRRHNETQAATILPVAALDAFPGKSKAAISWECSRWHRTRRSQLVFYPEGPGTSCCLPGIECQG